VASDEEARPGLAPGSRWPAGTLFAALYGDLAPHPWWDPEHDPYFLFHERSQAMGWLDDLWGMNDAGQDHPLRTPDAALVAWFQVGVGPASGDRPLPVQPFLRCAGDAVARMGTVTVRAVQVLLPVQAIDGASRPAYAPAPSLLTAGWFGSGDPRSRTVVRAALDSGQSPSIPAAAPRMREAMGRQEVFACESLSLADHDPLTGRPPFDDRLWNGPPAHRATFGGVLAEWSLDAVGWLAAFLADVAAGHGIATPLLLTVTRP